MIVEDPAGVRRVRTLAIRLAGLLLLLGMGGAAVLAIAIGHFRDGRTAAGPFALARGDGPIPFGWTAAFLSAGLAAMLIAGAVARATLRKHRSGEAASPEASARTTSTARHRRRSVVVMLAGLLALAGVLLVRASRHTPDLPAVQANPTGRP